MADYDIGKAFAEIEDELISSMTRNLKQHKVEEVTESMQWSQWQVEQLKALEEYKRKAVQKYGAKFSSINDKIEEMLTTTYNTAETKEEQKILKALQKGVSETDTPLTGSASVTGELFKTNDRKPDALIKSTASDMQRAEAAVLRMSNDKYRSIIFNAPVYANTGADTYEKAVDMATKDFLSAGINCIEYKNGRRVNICSYAEMATRTAEKRACLQGEGDARKKWGIHTVILNKRTNACPLCSPFVGKVIVDDVWSGGTAEEAAEKGYLLMSECIKQGLYHPNCQDSHTTYFENASDEEPLTEEEQELNKGLYEAEQGKHYCERQAQRLERMSKYSLDKDNQRAYQSRAEQWKGKAKSLELETKKIKDKVALVEEKIVNKEPRKIKNTVFDDSIVNLKLKDSSSGDLRVSHNGIEKYADKFNKTEKNSSGTAKQSVENSKEFEPLDQNRVVNILRQESDEWIQSLSDEERRSIEKYTKNNDKDNQEKFYARLNKMLRGKIPENDRLRYHAENISRGLKKNKLKHDIICYRSVDVNPVEGLQVGDTFEPKQFFSTSVTQSGALNKKCKIKILVPKGSNGAYIEKLSKYPKQREFLLDKDCKYRVKYNKNNKVILEVLS
ncbi:MAG: minor capsid protein [Lachnospiraceae bacterium]|nr:minor capsid protein [Lachnospiraceae bacterium]